jgi:DNA-binding transcriptional MerR regulator
MQYKQNSTYTKKRISEVTKLKERQVQFYTEQGVVTPELDLGEGRGRLRLYSNHNMVQFLIIKALADLGMPINKIKPLLKYIEKHPTIKSYEDVKLRKVESGAQLYLKVFIDGDKLPVGWTVTSSESEKNCSLIINFGRIVRAAGGE